MIRVLIVNDSISVQHLLKRILASDPELEIVGVANDGLEGIRMVKDRAPDVVLMDIRMPVCNGVEATRQIMEKTPCPILIVTASIRIHLPYIYECLNLGALEVIKTPGMERAYQNMDAPQTLQEIGAELLQRVKIVSKLRKQVRSTPAVHTKSEDVGIFKSRPENLIKGAAAEKVIAIGASTGGPNAILHVLQALPAGLNASIVLVQHIDSSFGVGLAEWLNLNVEGRLNIYAAKPGDILVKGSGFLPCADKDMVVGPDHSLRYQDKAPASFICPCIDVTFESVAKVYGQNAIGVLLTGMGDDGARGLKAMREAGGRTIAQDEKTSLIYGMPKVAKDIGAAEFVLPLENIAHRIVTLLKD